MPHYIAHRCVCAANISSQMCKRSKVFYMAAERGPAVLVEQAEQMTCDDGLPCEGRWQLLAPAPSQCMLYGSDAGFEHRASFRCLGCRTCGEMTDDVKMETDSCLHSLKHSFQLEMLVKAWYLNFDIPCRRTESGSQIQHGSFGV